MSKKEIIVTGVKPAIEWAKRIVEESLIELCIDPSEFDYSMRENVLIESMKKVNSYGLIKSKYCAVIKQYIRKELSELEIIQNNIIDYGEFYKRSKYTHFGKINSIITRQQYRGVQFYTSQLEKDLREKKRGNIWYSFKRDDSGKVSLAKYWKNWEEIPKEERNWFIKFLKNCFLNEEYDGGILETTSISIGKVSYSFISNITNDDFILSKSEVSQILYDRLSRGETITENDFNSLSISHRKQLKENKKLLDQYKNKSQKLNGLEEYFISEVYGVNILKTVKDNINKNLQVEKIKRINQELSGTNIIAKINTLGHVYYRYESGRRISGKDVPRLIKESKNIKFNNNKSKLIKLHTDATRYVKKGNRDLTYLNGQIGVLHKKYPNTVKLSVFGNNKTCNDMSNLIEHKWVIVLAAHFGRFSIPEELNNNSCLNVLFFEFISGQNIIPKTYDWLFSAITSMKTRDENNYSVSSWSEKVIKVVTDNGSISHLLNIPVRFLEAENSFQKLLKPAIKSLIKKYDDGIKDLDCFYIPENIKN